jgi:hypothetical protein
VQEAMMERHVCIYFHPELGMCTIVGKAILAKHLEVCSESFSQENVVYHYQAEHKDEVIAYLETKGVKVPV